jgi:NADH-quinone oxidoreductase subunit F
MNWRNYEKVLLPDTPNLHDLPIARANGRYKQIERILAEKWEPKKVVDTVKAANIRGRGGAGFNAGLKWSFMPPKKEGVPRYLAINGDESEPGTMKDRRLFEFNPHLLLEGILIACYAMELDAGYIYIRGEYADYIDMLQDALDQAYAAGLVGKSVAGSGWSCEIYIHKGAGAYICGEETSLMNSLEGQRGYPRSKPPFPAQAGLWGKPTTINNVETLCNVPLVIERGPEWFSTMGAPDHPGPVLYGISGNVRRPGVYEYPSGMLISDLIYEVAGGLHEGRKLQAVVPGGSSMPILRADQIEGITMNADSLKTVGTMMGTAGMCVIDDSVDIVKFLYRVTKFYDHESCGQCTPCREGTGWLRKLVGKFAAGEGTHRDLDLLISICDNMEGRTICALAEAAAWPVRNTITRFRDAFEARVVDKVVYAV